MPSDTKEPVEMIDDFFDWWGSHWRSVIYSFLAGILFTVTCAMCSAANAATYAPPPGAPTVFVPTMGVEVGVWAAQTPVGHGIGVFEKSGAEWKLCGVCIVSPEYPSMDGPVAAAGGPGPYVESKKEAINKILASRYPAVMPPSTGTTLERVNQSLAGQALRLVNGVPMLGPR